MPLQVPLATPTCVKFVNLSIFKKKFLGRYKSPWADPAKNLGGGLGEIVQDTSWGRGG